MKKIILASLVMASSMTFAGANCKAYPQEERMTAGTLLTNLEADGYTIEKFKIDDNCYEIYGHTREGKKAEIYFDMKTGEAVKTEIDD